MFVIKNKIVEGKEENYEKKIHYCNVNTNFNVKLWKKEEKK